MLTKLKWEPLKARRDKVKLTMMYKATNDVVELHLPDYIHRATTRTRRHHDKFVLPFARLNTFKGSFYPSTVRLWNSLPQHIIALPSAEDFKLALDRLH